MNKGNDKIKSGVLVGLITVLTLGFVFDVIIIHKSANGSERSSSSVHSHSINNNTTTTGLNTMDMRNQLSHQEQSPYSVGEQQTRTIKSLSDKDIESLQIGTGEAFGGIAIPAELNGYPGPRHVLDLVSELGLTEQQRVIVEQIYQNMKVKAVELGEQLITIENQISSSFENKTITPKTLQLLLDKSADLYGQLRYIHLSAHLQTIDTLTSDQINYYNKLRGYA